MADIGFNINLKNSGMDEGFVANFVKQSEENFWKKVGEKGLSAGKKSTAQSSGDARDNDSGNGASLVQKINVSENSNGSSQLSEAAMAMKAAAESMQSSLGRLSDVLGGYSRESSLIDKLSATVESVLAAAKENKSEAKGYDNYDRKMYQQDTIDRMIGLTLGNKGGILGWAGRQLAKDRQASQGAGIDINDKDYRGHDVWGLISSLATAQNGYTSTGANVADVLSKLMSETDDYHRKTVRDIRDRKGMKYDDARAAWKDRQTDNAIKLQQRAAEEAAAAAQAEKARAEEGQKADRARKQNDRIDAVKKDTSETQPSGKGKGNIDINNKGNINIENNRPASDSGGGAPSGGTPGGKSPGGGGPKRPSDGGAGGPGGPGAPGDNGNTPPKNPDTVRYFNNLNELNKTLRSEYKLDGIADDIQRQLTSLKSSASDIAATFDGNGKLSGISLNAKSIALGDVQTARLTYGVSESQGKYAWNGSAYQTKADDQRLKQGMEKLTRDTSTQQERLNSWLQHDALKLNKSGSNTMREQLLGDIADYVYQNAKGQVKLGHRDMETGRVTRLTSDELKAFTGTMDTFDKRMGAINKGMRQDMVSRGIDDIQGKYDKRIGQVAELKDRLRAVGINPDDKNAVFSSGESVRDLFKSIEKASQQFQGNEGDIAKQVKNYNQIHDLTNRAQLAVKQEERLSKAAVTGANREARIQTRRDAAQQALTAKNADKSPEQVERLNGALAELGKAKTPAQLVTALANVGKYTNELTQSTKEYNKQVTQTETRQEKFAATESKIKSLREQLAAVGIEQPKSLKDANTAANNYRMSKSAEKQQEWADKAAAQLGLAEGPATKLLNEFNKNSGKAENQYQRMLKNSMLGESDREAITKAFDAYTKRKDSSTLQGLQNALASASGNMARTSMENKSAELKERVTSKKADLDAYEKRAGGTNQWTDAERKLFETAGKNLERASELVQKGETSNARSYLSRASTQMSQLNKQLNESERAISQFEQDAGRAETRYNQFKDSGKLNALPQKQQDMINNAFKAFQANRNEQTLKNLTGSLTGGENVTRIQENRNKETDARLSLQKAADKLAGFDERSGNGKKLTDEQKGYRSQAAQFYSEAAKQIDAGQFDNAQKSIQQFNSALSTLTGSFNRSETAAKAVEKAQEAQRKEDERSSAAEAKELVKQGVKTENAQTKAEQNAYYGATKESSRDQLTDMAAIFKTTGSADDLKNYQKALTKVQWEEKAAQLKDYNQQLAMMANPNGMPGVDLSKNWASAQIAMRDEILKMQADFREASKASDQARADSILKQMGSKTSELSRSLADTQKLQDAAKALESTGNYSRVAQGLKDNLTTAMNEMMNTSSQDKFIEKMNAVRTAISNISSEMKQIGLDDYWNQQTAALQNYNNTLQGLTSRNGGQAKWTQGQRDAYAQAQQAYAEAEQAQQARDMGAYQEASKRGNERMNALNKSLTAVGRLSAESKPQVDALSRAMMNFAAPMMLFRKFTGYMKKAAQNVSAIDSQMADLKKVTSNTDAEYQIFLQRAGQHAVQIGSSITDLVATTSTFAHMGYNLNDSQALGVTATKFANVGGFKNTTDAADTIIAAIKGFKDLNIGDADEVGDKLTAVANNYAVTATDISEGLRHSASALNVAGNDIDQSTAMITAIAEVTRDAGGAGSALKVLSMRIRGAKAELTDAGESTEGMAESVSKLRSEVYGLTNVGGEGGVDIMANEDTFKSTYDILHDISKVWGKMSDINRSALLEKLAGKVRSNQVAALLENFDQAERVLETSQNAKGTMSQVHARWMDSVEARQAQFKAAQETASMAAMPASTLKGLYQAGTTGLGLLTQLMNFAGSGGVGLGAIGTAAALKSGAGNIWAGLGQALNIHKGGFGQKDLINAYNLAYMDNLSPTAGNKQASLQEAQRQTGIKPNKYTNNLVNQTDGAIDAAKATSSLATSLKGLAKNALGAVTTFALIEGASYLAQQAWGWVDKNVIHKNETLAAAADAATAVYKETKQSAEAAAAERDAVKERIVAIEKKRTNGTATKSDIAEAAMLESEVRELEYKASLEERKQLLKARDAFDKKGEQEAGYGATSEMYTLLGDLLEANPQNFGQWVGAIFGNIEQVAKAAGEGIKNAIVGMPTNATSEYAKTMSDTAARDARVASVPQDKRFIVNGQDRTKDAETIYQRLLAFSELQTRFKNVDSMSDAELAANYQLAVQERAAITSQLQSMPSTLLDYLNGRSAYDNFGSFFTYMQAATATRLATSESGLADLFDQYVTLASNNQASESDRQLMQSQMQSSLFLRLSMTDADKLEQATFDFFRNMFSESSYKDVISKMLELAAGGENAESIAETIGKEYSGLSGIMSMLGYSISNLASMAVNRTQDTEQQIHGAAVVEEDPYEKQNANVAALGTAQDLGAKLWKSTGFTGALDPTSKEYQELMAMDDGAYKAAIEHANGTLFFNKDAFDQIVQQKFKQELSDLQKDTADAEMKYAKAAQKLTEQLKFQQEGSDQFDADARNAAIADLQKYSAQLSGYRAMASQIDYGMSGLANWISNKNGAESGDAYDELSSAAKALREGKQSGLVGTREFSAALQFYGAEGLTLDKMSTADWNLIAGISGVDGNGKTSPKIRESTLKRIQSNLIKAGVLDKNGAVIDPTMTTDRAAEIYNKNYGTHLSGDVIQSAFMAMNDYIYEQEKKYTFANTKIANQDPEVVKAQEEFAAAAKAYQEATPEKQAEALAKAAEAGQKYIDAVNKSATTALIGSKDTMTAAQAAIEANQQAQDAGQTTAGTDQQAQGGDQQGEKSINEQLLEAVKEMNGNLAEIKTNTAPEKKPPEGEGEGEGETTPETPATASTEQGGRQEEAAGTGAATESETPPPAEPPKNPAIAAAEAAIAQTDAEREERGKVTSSANAALSNARDVGNAKGVTADRLQNLLDSGEGTTEDIAELTDQLASENDIQGTLLGLERVASEGNLSDETREALVNTINTLRDALGNPEADIEALLKDAASQMTDAWSESEANATQAFVDKIAEDQAKSARQEAVDAAKTLIDKNFDNMPTDGGPLNQAFNALQAAINNPESTNEQIKALTGQLSKALYDQQMAYQKQQAEREASLKSGTTGSQTDQRIAEERAKAEKRRAEAEAAAARAADKAAADQAANDFIDQYEDQFNQMQLGGPLDEAYTALVAGIANPDLTGEQVNALKDQLAARLAEQQEYDDAIAVSKAYETKKQEQQKRDEEAAKAAAAAEAQKNTTLQDLETERAGQEARDQAELNQALLTANLQDAATQLQEAGGTLDEQTTAMIMQLEDANSYGVLVSPEFTQALSQTLQKIQADTQAETDRRSAEREAERQEQHDRLLGQTIPDAAQAAGAQTTQAQSRAKAEEEAVTQVRAAQQEQLATYKQVLTGSYMPDFVKQLAGIAELPEDIKETAEAAQVLVAAIKSGADPEGPLADLMAAVSQSYDRIRQRQKKDADAEEKLAADRQAMLEGLNSEEDQVIIDAASAADRNDINAYAEAAQLAFESGDWNGFINSIRNYDAALKRAQANTEQADKDAQEASKQTGEEQKKAAIAAALAEDEEEMRQEYLEQYSEASDRAKTSGAYQGPGRAALDKAIDKIGEAFNSGDWNAFKQAVADLDNLMTAVDAADQERGEREARDESDAENAAALRARAEQRRQDALARAREESAYMDQFNDELAEETERQKEASARQEIEQFIADNGLVGIEAETYELAVNATASQEDLAHRQGPITPMNVEQPENEAPQGQLAGVAGQFLTWTGGELTKEFTSFLQGFTGQTEEPEEPSVPDTIVAVPITEDTQVSAAEQPELTIGLKAAQAQQAELDRIAAETDKMLTREIGERNIISGKQMQEAGWTDVPEDDYATLYSQTFTGNGKTVLASPITPSGEILSPEEFQAYIGELLESDLEHIFDNDTSGLLLGAMNGENQFTIKRMGAYAQQLHMQQEQMYGTGMGTGMGAGMGAGVATPALSATQNQTLDDLYDQAELLTAAITTYLAQNGYDGNETLWAKGRELNDALRQGNDANIGKLVKASDELIRAQLEQQGMTLEQFVETQGLLEKGFSSVVEASGTTESQTLTKAGQPEENAQQGVDVGVNFDVPEIDIQQPEDVQVGVVADTSKAQDAINNIDGGVINVDVQYNGGKMPGEGNDQGSGGAPISDVQQAATGTKNASNGPYLVDERGQELIEHVSKGTYELGTNDGPRFAKLDAGDIVHTAKETRKILRRGKAMANGGKVKHGKAYNTGIGSGKIWSTNPDANAAAIAAMNYASQQQQWNSKDPGPKSDVLASGTQILKFLQNVFDWIPTFLSVLKKKTTEFINAADEAIHYIGKNKMIDSAIGNVAEEIQANMLAALKYREFLVGMAFKSALPLDIIQQIQNGTLDIQKYRSGIAYQVAQGGDNISNADAMLKTIQAYQEYWNKLQACQDALKGLNDQMEALSKQKMDNIIHYFDQIDDLLSQQEKSYEALMDLKKQYGQEIGAEDYLGSLQTLEDMLDNTQKEEIAVVAELSDQLGVGEDIVRALLDGGKAVWEAIGAHVQKATDAGIAELTEGLAVQNEALAEGIENGTVPNYWATMYGQRNLLDPKTGMYSESIYDLITENARDVNAILKYNTEDVLSSSGVSNSITNRIVNYGLPKTFREENGTIGKNVREIEVPDPEDIFPLTMPVEPEVEPPTDEDIRAVGEMLGLNMADESEEALANFELVKSLFTTTWDNPLAIGSETWYSYMATLEELRGNIYSTKVEISEMNDEIAKIPLTNLQTGFDYLEDIMDNLEGINDLLDAQGAQKSSGTYESMISVGMKQIENLEEQNKLIEEQMSLLDPLSEKYQELRDDLNNNLDSIADIRENQERWNDAIIDLQIDRLRKQNDKYKEQLSLMRALDDLENARQRRILTYHDATGFVYEADEDAMESAQESAIDAMTSSMINALEDQKEISNIYGPLGERLIQGSSIVDSLGNILVPVEDKLSGLDFGSYYQSILDGAEQTGLLTSLLNSIDMTKLLESAIRENNISIDLSGMTLNEVNDVKDLCDAIMQQLPNYLLQAMYQKGA